MSPYPLKRLSFPLCDKMVVHIGRKGTTTAYSVSQVMGHTRRPSDVQISMIELDVCKTSISNSSQLPSNARARLIERLLKRTGHAPARKSSLSEIVTFHYELYIRYIINMNLHFIKKHKQYAQLRYIDRKPNKRCFQ